MDGGGEVVGDRLESAAEGIHVGLCDRLWLGEKNSSCDDIVVLSKSGNVFPGDKGAF